MYLPVNLQPATAQVSREVTPPSFVVVAAFLAGALVAALSTLFDGR